MPAVSDRASERTAKGLAALVVLLTAGLALVWSHGRLLWQDEFLSFYTDSVATARGVIDVQLHSPISLDPPTYHLLSHCAMDMVGRNAMALRLPALAGFLLMELSLFSLVRRLAGGRAAVIAMALPMMTASFRYAVEGRPYGLLLGLYGLAFLCWFVAAPRKDREGGESRALPLAGLAISIALAITSHYFGILILLPVCCGELARIAARKKLDWPMVAALAVGFAAVVLVLPFQHALLPYRQHYYIAGVSFHAVTQGYRELFVAYGDWPKTLQHVAALLLAVGTVALVWLGWKRYEQRPESELKSLWVGLIAFAALPFFSFLFGRFVTHTMEVRYVIATLIPFAVVIALLLAPALRRGVVFYGVLAAILIAATIASSVQIGEARAEAGATMASMTTPAAFTAGPSQPLSTQSLANFFLIGYYSPDPVVRQQMTLIYDEPREIAWLGHNTNAVTAVYMQRFTTLHFATFCEAMAQPRPMIVEYDDSWVWTGKELAADHVPVTSLGAAYRGELTQVPSQTSCPGGAR